jgi:prevent-host-death family protein
MKAVSVSDAKNNLSALLREVREGRTVTITDRGVVVARIVPPPPTRGVSPQAIDLAQRGLLVLPERAPNAGWLREEWPRAKGKASAVQALLDERDAGL